ncbi:serine O-acetyltransferase [Candidatus Purcelliella pentastirinorum]|uniref:Serine acetyltransferase n=1 Tax=Candidatus Purcelliella pentastirinorum TaxID=472834 RepID=A0A346E011_9ENTR|nr:serine O-acetyltransferase [Candidatus Purcelliella pentastirinorum]AXN02316.1 Serine acetyltransferase [Candidatus Purcelliella pentastirinorum]WDI78865.1 serine O-acetyltransferase [Candidatus Purcelliella pentastirinorum]WDR79998.1 serine O-acetyltransferase [Candidatus Purcelliella pentastirinorum]
MFYDKIYNLWNKIKKEIKFLCKTEPILVNFYNKNLLKRKDFADALNYLLSNKFADYFISFSTIYSLIKEIYIDSPFIVDFALYDIKAIYHKDPIVDKYSTPFLYFKGYHALQAYRITHWLWDKHRYSLALYLQNKISSLYAVDIHPAACIGYGVMFDHATGIVVGETTVIENNVSILQSVTLGGTGKDNFGNRHPKVREGVYIGAGAKILGNIEIGKESKIGAGSVVLKSIPPNSTAAGVPANIINRSNFSD